MTCRNDIIHLEHLSGFHFQGKGRLAKLSRAGTEDTNVGDGLNRIPP